MKPILFNTEMVRAILEGRKTVTRRVVKPQPGSNGMVKMAEQSSYPGYWAYVDSERVIKPPYQSGDVLYVRETWQFIPCIDCRLNENGRCNDLPVVYDDGDSIGEGCFVSRADYPETDRISWRPSIHMPREAARIFQRVTGVGVERLREITTIAAQKEGQPECTGDIMMCGGPDSCLDCEASYQNAIRWFSGVWDSTIPKHQNKFKRHPYQWDDNPWVWVIAFERVEAPA